MKAENSRLKEELLKATGKKRIILNDMQRRKLAILGKKLGRKLLGKVCCSFAKTLLHKEIGYETSFIIYFDFGCNRLYGWM